AIDLGPVVTNFMKSSFISIAPIKRIVMWAIASILVLLIWEAIGQDNAMRLLFSRPSRLVEYASTHGALVVRSTAYTALEAVSGLAIAGAFSMLFGLLCIYAPRLAAATYPFLVGSQTIPFICLAPLVILAFGPGVSGKIFLSFLMCFFPL